MEQFKAEQDYDHAYKQLSSSDPLRHFLVSKNKQQKAVIKEHVRNIDMN